MKKYLFIICSLVTSIVFSQNFVFDMKKNKPIEAVHISFNQNRGLATNNDGYFELPDNIQIDTLRFSHLLYKSKVKLPINLKKGDTIYLESSPIKLDEIVLNTINPKEIIIKAINQIDNNYISTPHNFFGFYRQSLQENLKGIEMIEVEFISYIKKNNISTKIVKARQTENYSKWNLKTYGGVSAAIENGDFVKRRASFLNINKINEYKFTYEGVIIHNNLKVYKINFSPIDDNNTTYLNKGSVYIESKSKAIVEVKYKFDKKKLLKIAKKSEKKISRKKPFYRLNDIENVIKYKQLPNKKWVLFYIDAYNLRHGFYNGETYFYNLRAKLIINNVKTVKPTEVKTNYNLFKDFNKAVKKFKTLKKWNNTYRFSLSNEEKKILRDINNRTKKYENHQPF